MEGMKVTLTKIARYDKDKAGKPLISKEGKPYTRVLISTQEHGAKQLSGFENQQNSHWKEGDMVEIEVAENGQYLNFKTLSKEDRANEVLREIVERQNRVEAWLKENFNYPNFNVR